MNKNDNPQVKEEDSEFGVDDWPARRASWSVMDLDTFNDLCRRQTLLSCNPAEPTNDCYDVALILYGIVHDSRIPLAVTVKKYLQRLEKLCDTRILVPAVTYLKARRWRLLPDLIRGSCELVDFLSFNRNVKEGSWHDYGSLLRAYERSRTALDSALLGDENVLIDCVSSASRSLSELKATLDERSSSTSYDILNALGQYISGRCGNIETLLLSLEDDGDGDLQWRNEVKSNIEKHLKPLADDMMGTLTLAKSSEAESAISG